MIAPLLLAAATPIGGDEVSHLRDIFVGGCVQGRIAASLLEEVPFEGKGKRFLRDLEGATVQHLFEIRGVEDSYFVFAQFAERPDGIERRCGVFSTKWNLDTAQKAVFSSPAMLGTEAAEDRKAVRHGRLVSGSRNTGSYQAEIAYGRQGRLTYMMLSTFDASAAARRLAAVKLLGACKEEGVEPGDCSNEAREQSMKILQGYN